MSIYLGVVHKSIGRYDQIGPYSTLQEAQDKMDRYIRNEFSYITDGYKQDGRAWITFVPITDGNWEQRWALVEIIGL